MSAMNQELINNTFGNNQPPAPVFDQIKISIASPEQIKSWRDRKSVV